MFRDPSIGTTALDSILDRFTPLNHLDKLRESLMTVSTIAIVGRRTAATSSQGTVYLKWQLTGKQLRMLVVTGLRPDLERPKALWCADLKECNVQCFAFGDAARSFSQIRPGTVVALLKATYDSSQQGCLKVNESKQVLLNSSRQHAQYVL